MDQPEFTPRQQEVIQLLLQGRSNKHIALTLGITGRTVEEHLKHIYTILGVGSAKEAIARLGKSTIGKNDEQDYLRQQNNWKFEREARLPDDHTVGHTIARSNATQQEVHGLFGAAQAWPRQPGFVRYNNIHVPKTNVLYLKLRYSKHSPASTPISIYLDHESTPRASFMPEDQESWNRFTWSSPIALGKVTRGVHSITFHTEGQEYGVADLDRFILTTDPPK